MASITRTFSALARRKRSATTSSSFLPSTSRSACTRVKPLADSHCSSCSARGVGGQFDREGEDQPRVASLHRAHQQVGVDRLRRVMPHRQRGLLVEQLRRAREQQLQVVVQLGHRADRAAAGAHRIRLVDGDGRRHAVHAVHRRAVHAVEELPRVGAEGLDVAPLPFGIQRVEHQAGLARTRGPGDHRHLAGADVEVQVLQVVLACAADADETGRHVAAEPGSKGRSRAF